MSGEGPFDRAYVAIGGGGLAASVACWLKKFWPHIKVIGVEGIDQASMKTSIEQGRRVNLDYVDVFCDGTAVHIPGELTYPLCRELVDEMCIRDRSSTTPESVLSAASPREAPSAIAVSYTHLDVYKRQGQNSGIRPGQLPGDTLPRASPRQ